MATAFAARSVSLINDKRREEGGRSDTRNGVIGVEDDEALVKFEDDEDEDDNSNKGVNGL